jgi:glutamate transport system permease protein
MSEVSRLLVDYGPAFGQALFLTWKLTILSFVPGFLLGVIVTVLRLLPLTPTAIIVLTVYEAAYVAEAVRSGVNTVPVGQVEASRALGFTLGQSLRLVVVPQALRAVVQPIGNVMIALAMNTALAAAVGVVELTAEVNKINLVAAQPILIFSSAGILYMAIALAIGLAAGWVERKVAITR